MKWLLICTIACGSFTIGLAQKNIQLKPAKRQAQKKIQLKSPNGQLVFHFILSGGLPAYDVEFKGRQVIANSRLGLVFQDRPFNAQLVMGKPVYRETTETYELIVGKTKKVNDPYHEVLIPLKDKMAQPRQVNLLVRAFNDGVAFRYEFPEQPAWQNMILTDEQTRFRMAGNATAHALFLPNYTSSHEGEYTTVSLQDMQEDTLMDMPALLELPGSIYVGITEAALVNYAGMYLMKERGELISKLSPLPKQTAVKVKASLPHRSPWRVLMISDRVGGLIESNILTDLNEPSPISDWSWLKPGKTTFPWWNGNVLPDTINAPGNNFVTQQYYIDFCARNGIEYHSVVEYGLHQWYMDDGIGFQPGPHSDPTTPVPGLDMKEVCDYAKSKGVGIRVWVHFYALYPKLDEAFAIFEKWGISGMMVDFMDRDDQEMVNMQTEILQKAAAHHLHIQFHGAYKPTGMHRTYPNEFTREGTLNYESNKWSKRVNPDHDINFPFTRMLAGSTDYHLGGFRAVTDSAFVVQYTRPLIIGTRCHMLAMYVVLENYLGMVCDYPAAYEGQPGFEFIREVPTVWDETKVLDAKPGEYILIARRKNQDWWLGAITNHSARTLQIPCTFLSEGRYEATMFTDAPDAHIEPNHLTKQTRALSRSDLFSVSLSGGGGFVAHFRKE
ncbi:MAG TPA: glycoside hydrolase family 97 protein [Puia sp.]|nr:glycoside hydrolase family 97 protein [Puia sp.]